MGYADTDAKTISQFTPAFIRAGELLFGKNTEDNLTENSIGKRGLDELRNGIKNTPANGHKSLDKLKKLIANSNASDLNEFLKGFITYVETQKVTSQDVCNKLQDWLGVDTNSPEWIPFVDVVKTYKGTKT